MGGRGKRGPAFLFDLDGTLVDSVYQHVLAWRVVTPSGSTTTRSAGTTAYSAYAPRMLVYATRSPGFGSVTPGPTALTTPAASCPRVNGVATL